MTRTVACSAFGRALTSKQQQQFSNTFGADVGTRAVLCSKTRSSPRPARLASRRR